MPCSLLCMLMVYSLVTTGKDVKPVRDLNQEEEFEHEGHSLVRISVPQVGDVVQVLPHHDVHAPHDRDQVEAQQLAGLVKLGVFDLGQVELLVDLVEEVLLDDGVDHHGDEKVEEGCRDVLEAGSVEGHVLGDARHGLHGDRHVVLEGDEDRGEGGGHLEHQAHHKHHRHAGHYVRVVLDHELMAHDGRVFSRLFASKRHPEADGLLC